VTYVEAVINSTSFFEMVGGFDGTAIYSWGEDATLSVSPIPDSLYKDVFTDSYITVDMFGFDVDTDNIDWFPFELDDAGSYNQVTPINCVEGSVDAGRSITNSGGGSSDDEGSDSNSAAVHHLYWFHPNFYSATALTMLMGSVILLLI